VIGARGPSIRSAHNPEVAGSNPAPATEEVQVKGLIPASRSRVLDHLPSICHQDSTVTSFAAFARSQRHLLASRIANGERRRTLSSYEEVLYGRRRRDSI